MLKNKCILIFLLSFCYFGINGQSLKYYENKRQNNKKSIVYSKKLLHQLQNDNKQTLDQLYLIKNEINTRESTILIINRELQLLAEKISRYRDNLQNSYSKLEMEKNEYAKLIYYSYLNLSVQDRMIYLLSAVSFNNVYKRIIYLKQLSDYRKQKYMHISSSIRFIDSSLVIMRSLESEKKLLYRDKVQERDSLIVIKKKLHATVSNLKRNLADLNTSQKQVSSNKKLISSNVNTEISKNILNSKEVLTNKSNKFDKNLGKDFAKYRKNHLWPLREYVILHKFGNYAHPVLNDIVLKNDGVELGAMSNSNVYAVYKGLVVSVLSIPGLGQSIIIKHGEYFSVYSQVGKVYIAIGQSVTRGQRIAQLKDQKKLEKLIFQIWKGKKKLDPQKWLMNK